MNAMTMPVQDLGAETNRIVEQIPLVKKIAMHLLARMPAGIEADDLIQAGMIGLIAADRDFSPDRGASFSTYAGIRIRGAILDEVRQHSWAPRSVHKKSQMLARAVRSVEARTGEAATDVALAEELGVGLDEYHAMAQDVATGQLVALPEDDYEYSLHSDETPETQLEEEGLKDVIRGSIDDLPEREKLFMALYYQEELNLKEIGEVLGVSESRACQIHGQALSRIRARVNTWSDV